MPRTPYSLARGRFTEWTSHRTVGCLAISMLLMRIIFISLIAAPFASATEPTPEQLEFFEKKIRPIFVERCYKCHSSQSEKLKGGLLLDSQEGIMKGGEDGPVITPGAPEKS